ncbi:ADP-ribosylglycohydrolase family protein [Thermomonospora umbrina]|uniref:ADP-ribosylglycohydrolase family protein n=1 Tax=Thermomonospora umbrina TaxID=111806 RepID=UPI001FE77783|nr:ADP-ribosylglycohydrolase family protein [Thermomonospora umbrina]
MIDGGGSSHARSPGRGRLTYATVTYGTVGSTGSGGKIARHDPLAWPANGLHPRFERVRGGEPWLRVSRELFDGRGSYGNGGAMRVAPLGAYHHDDLSRAAAEAALSAEVTHSNADGIAGAVAVAVATHLTDFEGGVRAFIAVGGDIDTTAAITAHTGAEGIPPSWPAACEPLPGWMRPM